MLGDGSSAICMEDWTTKLSIIYSLEWTIAITQP